MADLCDIAQENYEVNMAKALIAVTVNANSNKLRSTGFCLSCGEKIIEGSVNARFCDVLCRNDYDRLRVKNR